MALTKITTGVITDGTITSADMAVDPTNATNLTSGAVAVGQLTTIPGANITGTIPLAALGNAPATDTTSIEDDIALLGFRIAANGSLAKYNLDDQIVDAFQDTTGVDAGASTNEIFSSSKYFSGDAFAPTGGLITTYGSYTVHSFLTSSNFVVNGTGSGTTVDYFLVAGGGAGGGSAIPGGGGAGGFLTATGHTVSAQNYAITVGAGGIYNTTGGSQAVSKNGGDSVFSTITAIGGGGGASGSGGAAADGGSGGGACGYNDSYGSGTAGQGNRGAPNSHPPYGAGGGGGAGEVGFQPPQTQGGAGGDGLQNDFRTGSNVWYAGGGGGARWTGGTGGAGGQGGGGHGLGSNPATVGSPNTGGGGGGQATNVGGVAGGSGIVVLRFTTGSLESDDDMTLVSTATTAVTEPTKSDIVLTHTNGAGTTTLNTDLIASVSRDGGTTYTAATLVNQGLAGGHNIATAHDFSIAAQPSGSSMRWKVQTVNQSVSKKTRIQAISMGWS